MLTTCPVLHLSDEIEQVLHWFSLTHEIQSDGLGSMRWVRTALPHAGGLGDQDNRLLESLMFMRQLSNRLLYEAAERRKRERETEEWKTERQKRRG